MLAWYPPDKRQWPAEPICAPVWHEISVKMPSLAPLHDPMMNDYVNQPRSV